MENVRIDKGMKRKWRAEARDNPVAKKAKVWTRYTSEQREAILATIPDAILAGETVSEVAAKHNIPQSTLYSWVMGDPSTENARAKMIAAELMAKISDIQEAGDPLELARAREGFRAWSWIAERREARLYGQQTSVKVEHSIDLGDRLRRAKDRVGRVLEHGTVSEGSAPAALPVARPGESGDGERAE
jgi:hypothetical protein